MAALYFFTLYFFNGANAASPGLALAEGAGVFPETGLFLSAFGFLASRLPFCCPFAIVLVLWVRGNSIW